MDDLTRDEVIAKLKAAGVLVAKIQTKPGWRQLTDTERDELGRLPPGSPTTTEIIDEDRGEQHTAADHDGTGSGS